MSGSFRLMVQEPCHEPPRAWQSLASPLLWFRAECAMRFDESLRYLPAQDIDNVAVDDSDDRRIGRGLASWAVWTGSWSIPAGRTLRYYVVTPIWRLGDEVGAGAFCARLS